MKFYFAGNFPQMKNPELEKAMKEKIESLGYTYRRLISFYYAKDSQTILDLKEEKNEGQKTTLVSRS